MSEDLVDGNAGLLEELKRLEVELHSLETRRNRARMESLLHPEFLEFGRSGQRYSREEVLSEFQGDATLPAIHAHHYELTLLAKEVALLTYVSAHVGADGSLHRHTLRGFHLAPDRLGLETAIPSRDSNSGLTNPCRNAHPPDGWCWMHSRDESPVVVAGGAQGGDRAGLAGGPR